MRRGIGVAHVQKLKEAQRQMTDLGAQITAERVGHIADQLEDLEEQLRALAQKHKNEIKRDPVVRQHFKQLSDSLGVDLISSKKNAFAGLLGLGDFYYDLAGKVVEACIKERKFCGSYVPLSRVVALMNKQYRASMVGGKSCVISNDDVRTALSKLHVLGDGYNLVKFNKVSYIQTTPDGSCSTDDVAVVEYVLNKRAKLVAEYQAAQSANSQKAQAATSQRVPLLHSATSLLPSCVHACHGTTGVHKRRDNTDASNTPFESQAVAVTLNELVANFKWELHRCEAVLRRMVQNGSVWVEQTKEEVTATGNGYTTEKSRSSWAVGPSCKCKQTEHCTVYWFVDLVVGGEVT
ncbi:hypothetical protein TRVL_03810 [Trypanosoma vivax]|nr:hypothetical protein TRVL_03810 [Trypanosoma vivax]